MARLSLSSLRIRLLLLVLLGVLPALGLTLYVSWEHERQARAAVQHDALRMAELAAADHQRLIEGARQLLAALARLPDVRQASPACPGLFADLLTQYRSYANLGMADPTGHVVCSGVPLAGPASAADRAYFHRALTTRAFAVGEYQVGRITGRAAVNFGQPILDSAGHVTGVVFAALDLGSLNEFAQQAAAPPGSTFTVVDRAGVVLARYPDGEGWIGKPAADTALIALVLKRGKGVAEVSGVDGVPQLFGFTPLDERRDIGAAFVSIGIPSTAAYAGVRRLLLWNLVGLGIAGLVVLLATYQFADRLILRRMDALVTATDRLARGDVRVRTGLAQEQGELGHLGRAFDSMAEALAQRQAENERRRREAERLAEIGRAILQAGGPEEAGQRIADSLRELLGGTAATVYRVEPGSEDLVAVASSGDQGPIEGRLSLPTGTGAAGVAVRLGVPITSPDILTDARIPLTPEARMRIEQGAFRAVLAVPLMVQRRIIGALGVGDRAGRIWADEEVQLARAFADQAAIALESAQTQATLATHATRLQILHEIDLAIITETAPVAIAEAVLGRLRDLLGVPRAIVNVFDWAAGEVEWLAAVGRHRLHLGPGVRYPLALAGDVEALRRGEPQVIDVHALPPSPEAAALLASGVTVYMVVPMIAGGELIGSVSFGGEQAHFLEEQVRIAQEVAAQLAIALRQARLVEALRTSYQDLQETQAQLLQAQKMEAIGQLAGGVAHDFNNLLTVITGRSALTLSALPADHPHRRNLELIETTAQRAAALTRQLLAFSRKQILEPKVLDLNAVVAGLAPMLRRLIGEDLELTAVPAPDLGPVKADPSQLEQIIVNLVVNARDAMPQGGRLTLETANVELDDAYTRHHPGATAGPYVMLAVSDTGHGMDAATQARIFEPFFTTKEPGKGTGLGLATVFGIVKQSGGNIWVYSEPGHGTTFKVYLPRVDDQTEQTEPAAAVPVLARGSERILLVEDDDEVRALARETLEGNGYAVIPAASAAEALRVMGTRQEPIHLLVTDVVLPQMSGRGLADRLTPDHRDLRVLYISGYTDDAVVRHGVLAGGTAFLQKPFMPVALLRKVREVLDQAG